MPLEFSELIEREKLYAVSGGRQIYVALDGQNPLKLATPISYCGGRALATKNKVVAHITVKETNNLPLPTSQKQDFVLWRISSGTNVPHDFTCITARNAQNNYTHQKAIPLFWEPENQKRDEIKNKKESKVMYAGHWKLKESKVEQRVILGQNRCGSLTFSFHHFDETFAKVIAKASPMTVKEIKEYKFDTMLNTGAVHNGNTDEVALVEAKPERAVSSDDTATLNDTSDTHGLTDETSASESMGQNATGNIKTEENIKAEAPSSSSRKRNRKTDSAAANEDDSRETKRSHTIKAEENVATSVPKSKKKRMKKSEENARADDDSKPAARAATPPLQSKTLKDYTRDEVFDLVYEKGSAFRDFAKRLKAADIKGKLLAKQLATGDDEAFLTYLKDVLGFKGDLIYRVSLMESFKEIL